MPQFDAIVREYLRSFQQAFQDAQTGNQHTIELSFRPPLDVLFRAIADEVSSTRTIVSVFEPRNQGRMGRPDWLFHHRNTLGVYGYIEAKGFTQGAFNLTSYSEQFNRYRTLGHKLVITDGIDFVYAFDEGAQPQVIPIIEKSRMTPQAKWSRLQINPQFEMVMRRFFTDPTPRYCDEGSLVEQVAIRTRVLSDDILRFSSISLEEAMDATEIQAITLLHDLRQLTYNHTDPAMRGDKVFADFAAQVVMFTLLYAHRVECTDADEPTEKERKIRQYLARELDEGQKLRPFLKIIKCINSHESVDSFIHAWTNECIAFLSFVHMNEQQKRTPDYHRLFEQFLSRFDPQSRFDYGAYYTPSELADFIVRLTEFLAHEAFNGMSCFGDGNTIIDPCCGTGSFLERIRLNDTRHGAYSLCGIEILPTPYMLANYRMAMLNEELKCERATNELLLANTLSNVVLGEDANAETIEGYELTRAREVSSPPITLIIGNPPSSDSSKINTGADFSRILELMSDFRPPAERRHGRQNIQKQVNNPHLQFLRWGCEKLRQSENHTILSYIVPATFLEAESYRYARQYMVEHFSMVWVVSIDGDARAGMRTDSMFRTQQGRAILIAARRYGEKAGLTKYQYADISRLSRTEKIEWLAKDASKIDFISHTIDAHYILRPSMPFNEALYETCWPVSGENEPNAIFNHHCSGVKLAPSSLFTHIKAPMLRRRSRDIMQRGVEAAEEWLSAQDKPPDAVEVRAFAQALNDIGDSAAVNALIDANIIDYAFRPFLTAKAFLWQDLLHRFERIGGGGTRRRPELNAAYSQPGTIGFAISHSPKDQSDILRPFASFCWTMPDNDMCRRGNSFVYLNRYSVNHRGGRFESMNNINARLRVQLNKLLGETDEAIADNMIFYTYAVLCSQIYLDEFEGALYTTGRLDLRPRIPIVDDKEVFHTLVALGRRVANLERRDYVPSNIAGYNAAEIKAQIPADFRLIWTKALDPFDEETETVILKDGREGVADIIIKCPLVVQNLNISGYEVIKNCWMKFNAYDYTHCPLTPDDIDGLLTLINKLLEYIGLVGEIDAVIYEILNGNYPLVSPRINRHG